MNSHFFFSHEDIYNTLTSIIHSYNTLDNKLERHEYRDRTTQELFKRAFQNIQKGQKALEPLPDIISRLDDRINQIETILLSVSIFSFMLNFCLQRNLSIHWKSVFEIVKQVQGIELNIFKILGKKYEKCTKW